MIKLFNTLGRELQDFKPLKAGEVKLYTCGPTVYDYQHLGNYFGYVHWDSLVRLLTASGYGVKRIMNITDVGHLVSDEDDGEDKLEKGAKREGKTVHEVAKHYTDDFLKSMKALNMTEPNAYAKATDYITDQLAIIQKLEDRGFAYRTEQAIYFNTSKLKDYGKLSGQSLADKEVGARHEVVTDAAKYNPQDFALWFFTIGRFADHELRWDSPWGEGFPGWHLECSAIIHKCLGEPIDIHTGGIDHIGTHHTNEIAQSEAAYDKPLANFWLHNNHMMIEGRKISKSLGNGLTLADLAQKGFSAIDFRLLVLQSHYRSQTNFTWDALAAAKQFLQRLQAWADLVHQPELGHHPTAADSYPKALEAIKAAIANDLSTTEALSVIAKLAEESEAKGVDTKQLGQLLTSLDELLGLDLSNRTDIADEQKSLLSKRQAAREAEDWGEADKIRDQLRADGVEVNDTPHGQVWSRLTS